MGEVEIFQELRFPHEKRASDFFKEVESFPSGFRIFLEALRIFKRRALRFVMVLEGLTFSRKEVFLVDWDFLGEADIFLGA